MKTLQSHGFGNIYRNVNIHFKASLIKKKKDKVNIGFNQVKSLSRKGQSGATWLA